MGRSILLLRIKVRRKKIKPQLKKAYKIFVFSTVEHLSVGNKWVNFDCKKSWFNPV